MLASLQPSELIASITAAKGCATTARASRSSPSSPRSAADQPVVITQRLSYIIYIYFALTRNII